MRYLVSIKEVEDIVLIEGNMNGDIVTDFFQGLPVTSFTTI